MAKFVYSIPCECGKSYIGETGRLVAMWFHEHRHILKWGGSFIKPKIKNSSSYKKYNKKYKKSAHVECLTNPFWLSPIWISFISNEIKNPQRSVCDRFFTHFYKALVPNI
jgi:hypothetical protein